MNMRKIALLAAATAMSSSMAFAAPAFTQGVSIAYGSDSIASSQPHDTDGYRLAYNFGPNNWSWYNNNLVVYLQASYAYWHTSTAITNGGKNNLNVVAFAPVARWYFASLPSVAPYLEASVGAAALSNSNFGNRMLGSRLLFQDVGGIGAAFGQNKQLYASVSAIHYSNAGIRSDNDGVTVPVMLTVGYQFS
ncbi:MAG: pagL [Gammaproteobacteria bacterium]|jgi:lipid A 3-O-deacylase|nr:pagL [Gammaproteobacteria bacterium]